MIGPAATEKGSNEGVQTRKYNWRNEVAEEPLPAPPSDGDHSPGNTRNNKPTGDERKGAEGAGLVTPDWKLTFGLFAAGFVLLVIAAKLQLTAAFDWALKGVGAAACAGAFLLARRAQRKPRK